MSSITQNPEHFAGLVSRPLAGREPTGFLNKSNECLNIRGHLKMIELVPKPGAVFRTPVLKAIRNTAGYSEDAGGIPLFPQ
ncbi:MAG: hypothetical protein LBL70_07340 [Treponema sp.]|jgi:hypothetical protein|nr:hypothetical protein [Treponema sp.]